MLDNVTLLASEYSRIIVIVHVFFVILGMGSALLADILFHFYVKDRKINVTQDKTLNVISRVIWTSFGFIVLTGLLLFFSNPEYYINSTKFLVKMLIVGVLIINGYLFWRITHKSLRKIDFTDTDSSHKYVKIRRLSFGFGSVSLVSWLCVFVLGSVPSVPFSFTGSIFIYVILLVVGVIGSQIFEYLLVRNKLPF